MKIPSMRLLARQLTCCNNLSILVVVLGSCLLVHGPQLCLCLLLGTKLLLLLLLLLLLTTATAWSSG